MEFITEHVNALIFGVGAAVVFMIVDIWVDKYLTFYQRRTEAIRGGLDQLSGSIDHLTGAIIHGK